MPKCFEADMAFLVNWLCLFLCADSSACMLCILLLGTFYSFSLNALTIIIHQSAHRELFDIGLYNNVTGSWKTYLLDQNLWENSIENLCNFFKIQVLFPGLDTVTIKPSCYEISHQKLHFPRRYWWLYQTNQCAQKVGFPRSGRGLFHRV